MKFKSVCTKDTRGKLSAQRDRHSKQTNKSIAIEWREREKEKKKAPFTISKLNVLF